MMPDQITGAVQSGQTGLFWRGVAPTVSVSQETLKHAEENSIELIVSWRFQSSSKSKTEV